MNYSALFAFLTDLKAHNDRPWFQEHKATYDQLRAEFEEDVNFWAAELAKLDPALAGIQARKSLFRIYRDVRFSKNKDPYKTHFSAYFTAGPSKDIDSPGYYLQLGPQGQTLIAGGLYMPDKAQLAAIRQEIDYNADRLHGILKAPDYQAYFSGLGGDRLQRPPGRLRRRPPRSRAAQAQGLHRRPRAGRCRGAEAKRFPGLRAGRVSDAGAAV